MCDLGFFASFDSALGSNRQESSFVPMGTQNGPMCPNLVPGYCCTALTALFKLLASWTVFNAAVVPPKKWNLCVCVCVLTDLFYHNFFYVLAFLGVDQAMLSRS